MEQCEHTRCLTRAVEVVERATGRSLDPLVTALSNGSEEDGVARLRALERDLDCALAQTGALRLAEVMRSLPCTGNHEVLQAPRVRSRELAVVAVPRGPRTSLLTRWARGSVVGARQVLAVMDAEDAEVVERRTRAHHQSLRDAQANGLSRGLVLDSSVEQGHAVWAPAGPDPSWIQGAGALELVSQQLEGALAALTPPQNQDNLWVSHNPPSPREVQEALLEAVTTARAAVVCV